MKLLSLFTDGTDDGISSKRAVTMNAEELQYKENLHTAISAAISAASMLG